MFESSQNLLSQLLQFFVSCRHLQDRCLSFPVVNAHKLSDSGPEVSIKSWVCPLVQLAIDSVALFPYTPDYLFLYMTAQLLALGNYLWR